MRYVFWLFAPQVAKVELVGSWRDDPAPMKRSEDGTWVVRVNLPEGTHHYRFRLPSNSPWNEGKTIEIVDPMARRVDERENAGVVIVENGKDVTTAYRWAHDDVPLAPDDALVIYELHVGEFGWTDDKPGTFSTVVDKLDYLRDLGVNAVELMPIAAFPGDRSWGYNVRHAIAPDSAYGAPKDLKRLIDECHGRGIRVFFDLVLNHAESEAPLTQIDFYYWFKDPVEGQPSYGAQFDYERYDETLSIHPARKFSREVALYWLREYHIDGYRLDATRLIDNYDFLRELRLQCQENAGGKPFYVVAEHLPEDPSIAGPDAPVDGAWRKAFLLQLVATLCGRELDGASPGASGVLDALNPANQGYVSTARCVNYTESHDDTTLVARLAECGIEGDAAFRRVKLAASLLFTAVGNPMLFMGQEFGGYRPRTEEIIPLQWELLEADNGLYLKEHYTFLARLRHEQSALRGEEFAGLFCENDVIAFRRGDEENGVIALANLADEDKNVDVPFPDGAWREVFSNNDIDVDGGVLHEALPASGMKLYVRR